MTHDGLGKDPSDVITKSDGPTANIVSILKEIKETETDVVVSYLPVSAEMTT